MGSTGRFKASQSAKRRLLITPLTDEPLSYQIRVSDYWSTHRPTFEDKDCDAAHAPYLALLTGAASIMLSAFSMAEAGVSLSRKSGSVCGSKL